MNSLAQEYARTRCHCHTNEAREQCLAPCSNSRLPASYLVTIGDTCTEHESFDAACGHARNELMLGRRPVIIEHGAERFVMDTHGDVERVAS